MNKLTSVFAGLSLVLVAGAASAAPSGTGGSGTGGSGTAGTGVDVVAGLILAGNPSTTRSAVGGLANALLRITSGGNGNGNENGNGNGQGKDKDKNR